MDTGDVLTRHPCSGFADFLYSNRIPKNPASAYFALRTTGGNVAKGAAAGCKGCALLHDAVTTFKRGRLPTDDCFINCVSINDMIESRCLKIILYLHSDHRSVEKKDGGTITEPVFCSYADEAYVREYLEVNSFTVRLDWSRSK